MNRGVGGAEGKYEHFPPPFYKTSENYKKKKFSNFDLKSGPPSGHLLGFHKACEMIRIKVHA